MLSVAFIYFSVERLSAERHSGKRHSAECRGACFMTLTRKCCHLESHANNIKHLTGFISLGQKQE